MINTLLEHVPIKMEVNDVEEKEKSKTVANDQSSLDMPGDDEDVIETDSDELEDDVEEEDDDDDEDDTDLESEVLEIEHEATLLISSDEEAELEAQRIRFPDILVSKKSQKDSYKTSHTSSSRNNFSSNDSSTTALSLKPLAKTKHIITATRDSNEIQEKKQRISAKSINSKNNKSNENGNLEEKNNSTATTALQKSNTENIMKSENVNKTKNGATENVNKPLVSKTSSNQKNRRESNNSICSVASTVASDTAETESCGNIYVFNLQQKLIFNCEFCDLKYGDLENFGLHLHDAHKQFNFDEDPEKENAIRNVRKINKSATNNFPNVKKEPLQVLGSLTAESPSPQSPPTAPIAPPVALPLSVLAEPLDSCGNVFMLNHRKLFLVCGYCECKYANLDLFEKHLRQQHRIFEGCCNEVNVVPKIEVKEEIYITAEVTDKPDSIAPQAMVTIPAEIPLDISINSENEHETLKALEDIADIGKDCSPQIEADNLKSTEDKIDKVIKESENKVPNENISNETLADTPQDEEKTKRKRRSSAVNPLLSPVQRPKRYTRNATMAIDVSSKPNEESMQPVTNPALETIEETSAIIPTTDINQSAKEITEISKSNETKEIRKTRSSESKKLLQADVTDNKKSLRSKDAKKTKQTEEEVCKEIEKPKQLKLPQKRKVVETNSIETNKINPNDSVDLKKAKERTTITTSKKLTENVKDLSKDAAKIENKDSKNTSKVVEKPKKSMKARKATATKRKAITNKIKLDTVLEENQVTPKTTVEEVAKLAVEAANDDTAISCETKKPRRTIKTKVEKDFTPPPTSLSCPIPASTPTQQVERIQVPQLPEETVHYDENLMHDLSTDPVNDIIEQIQNEFLQNEQREQASNATASTVTFTINTVEEHVAPKTDENLILSIKTPASDLNSPEDIKPFLVDNVKRFVCDQCPRSFKKHVRLVEHKRLHTGEKPFSCDECGKQFRIRMRLNEHKLRHSKEKKFKCEICQLACCTKQDLNLHMRHHTNDRRFQCTMCPKAFVRSSDLKIHVRVHTGEKPYVCDICHKCFRANQNLIVHKKSHMGEASKTYKCEHCEKKFMRNIDRKVHMRSHTGEKPYKCEICQRGYSSKFNVRAHIERDHISANGVGAPPRGKKKPGPKPKALREELAKQKKLIEELQQQLLQQIKTDEKIISGEEDMHTLQDCTITPSSSSDPIQSAYELLNQLKSNATTSKPLTIIPSPPPTMAITSPNAFSKTKTDSTTLLPLTITQKIEQHSPASSTPTTTASVSCLTTPSPPPPPPPKTTSTKVVSQKTSLGIQQVSVTVSMQVENVTANPTTPEKENAGDLLTTSSSNMTTSVKKERKITSYFTVLGQKTEIKN